MAMEASKALNSLGKSAMQMLEWQMNKKGFEMSPDIFGINKFSAVQGDFLARTRSR